VAVEVAVGLGLTDGLLGVRKTEVLVGIFVLVPVGLLETVGRPLAELFEAFNCAIELLAAL